VKSPSNPTLAGQFTAENAGQRNARREDDIRSFNVYLLTENHQTSFPFYYQSLVYPKPKNIAAEEFVELRAGSSAGMNA
jgi:hypothetical protein